MRFRIGQFNLFNIDAEPQDPYMIWTFLLPWVFSGSSPLGEAMAPGTIVSLSLCVLLSMQVITL